MPVFALIPGLLGHGVPLSRPTEEAKGAGRGLNLFVAMLFAFAISGLAMFSRWAGWFCWFLGAEAVFAIGIYAGLRLVIGKMRWPASE